jgi:Domain of unknown function (DUF4258)
MGGPDDPGKKPGPLPVVRPEQRAIPREQPAHLSAALALKVVRLIAADTDNIVVIPYGRRRAQQRNITRRQIELCVQKGTIVEGPFLNQHGNWQMNFYRHAAGEEVTCVVAIEWATRVLVINAF